MFTFQARNTNELMGKVYPKIDSHGILQESRNGPVKRLPGVVTVMIRHPWERVNFSAARDANPFFHHFEAMCMLAGDVGNNVKLLAYFAKNMMNFSDDGERYNAFYGTRVRAATEVWPEDRADDARVKEFYRDQLHEVIEILKADPGSRQALVQIWDPSLDLGRNTKDKACNLCMIFEICSQGDCVNMTTFNRSNDAIWGGVTGANVVHFPFFQEYVACALGKKIGYWQHTSANLHVYTDNPKWAKIMEETRLPSTLGDPGMGSLLYPDVWNTMFEEGQEKEFDVAVRDLVFQVNYIIEKDVPVDSPEETVVPRVSSWNLYVNNVAFPMAMAYICWKRDLKQLAFDWLKQVEAPDWRIAGLIWFHRRMGKNLSPHLMSYPDELFTA